LFLPVRRTRARGRGGEGGTTIAFPGSILGDARRPLSAPCTLLSALSKVQARIREIEILEVHPAMCGATGLVLIGTINLNI
jgi:hypothetical protein